MHRKIRKKRRVCKSCKTRFSGRYCPYCGAEYGQRHSLRTSGFIIVLLRFLFSVVLLAFLLFLAFASLDYVASVGNGSHTTAIAIVSSVKNALPKPFLQAYLEFKLSYLDFLFPKIIHLT